MKKVVAWLFIMLLSLSLAIPALAEGTDNRTTTTTSRMMHNKKFNSYPLSDGVPVNITGERGDNKRAHTNARSGAQSGDHTRARMGDKTGVRTGDRYHLNSVNTNNAKQTNQTNQTTNKNNNQTSMRKNNKERDRYDNNYFAYATQKGNTYDWSWLGLFGLIGLVGLAGGSNKNKGQA